MRPCNRVVVGASLAAGLALVATPAAAAPGAAPKGACKYLTTRQAGRILGTPASTGESTVNRSGGRTNQSCVWNAKKKGAGGLEGQALSLEIAVESGEGLVDDYEVVKADDPLDTEEVAGLGDDAFVKDLDLHVLVGDRVLSVELHNYRYPEPLTQEQILQKEEDAAELVLNRLS